MSFIFIILAIVLFLAWVLGYAVYHVTATAIHILLILAIASVVMHFVRGGTAKPRM